MMPWAVTQALRELFPDGVVDPAKERMDELETRVYELQAAHPERGPDYADDTAADDKRPQPDTAGKRRYRRFLLDHGMLHMVTTPGWGPWREKRMKVRRAHVAQLQKLRAPNLQKLKGGRPLKYTGKQRRVYALLEWRRQRRGLMPRVALAECLGIDERTLRDLYETAETQAM